jgi:hypothetical protein
VTPVVVRRAGFPYLISSRIRDCVPVAEPRPLRRANMAPMLTRRLPHAAARGRSKRPGPAAFPATVAIGGTISVLMIATIGKNAGYEALARRMKSSWLLLHGRGAYRLVTSAFLQSRAGVVIGIVILLLLLPLAEHFAGSGVAAAGFFLGDWTSSLVVMAGMRLMVALDSPGARTARHALSHPDSGASAGLYACAAIIAYSVRDRRWQVALFGALGADLVIEGAVTHSLASVQHPIAALVGISVASWAARRRTRAIA